MFRDVNHKALQCDYCEATFDDRPRHQGNQLEKAKEAGWEITDNHKCPDCVKGNKP